MQFRGKDIPPVIALCGLKGSGKTYCANYLAEAYGYQRLKFAAPIKNMLRAMGLTEQQLEGDDKEIETELLCGKTPRHAMQSLGTEWGRGCIDEKIWVRAWSLQVQRLLKIGLPVVVDDLRFVNEAEEVRKHNGLILLIKSVALSSDEHPSEVIDFEYDLELESNDKVKDLLGHALKLWTTSVV